jgi:hypothetical protein
VAGGFATVVGGTVVGAAVAGTVVFGAVVVGATVVGGTVVVEGCTAVVGAAVCAAVPPHPAATTRRASDANGPGGRVRISSVA